ncbi:MAG: hypothetical protein ACI3T9_05365 [Romboutsia timonensis]
MITNNTTMKNDMIKTERIIRHTICCPNCGGSIRLKPDKPANEFDALLKQPRNKFSYTNTAYLNSLNATKIPTCTDCGNKFQIKVNTEDFTIEIREL